MGDIEFTRYCDEAYRREMRPKIERVLEEFPEFAEETVQIGHTNRHRNIAHYPSEASVNDRNYVRLSKGVSLWTINHELHHVLTREKAVDVLAMARSPDLIDEVPYYLEIPEEIEVDREEHRRLLYELACEAKRRFHEKKEMVHWFEEKLEHRIADDREVRADSE